VSQVELSALSLAEEAVLLALDGHRSRLRLVVKAAGKGDGEGRATLHGVLRSLRRRRFVQPIGRRRYEATAEAGAVDRRHHVGATLWAPKAATTRDIDLAVLLLASGTLSARPRRLARGLMVSLPQDAISPTIAWLMRRYAVSAPVELADAILREVPLPRHFEENAFNPGVSDVIY
jgi:sirohydrochlorin ferrochelatase